MIGSLFGRQRRRVSPETVSARILTEALRSCPRCGLPLTGHEYRLAAATPLSAEEMGRFKELLSAIRNQDWPRVLTFQCWIGSQPNAEVYGVRCPDHQLSFAVVSAPFELDEPYMLMYTGLIDEAATFIGGLPDTDTWHRC